MTVTASRTFDLIWGSLFAKIHQNVEIFGVVEIFNRRILLFCNWFKTTQHPRIWRIETMVMTKMVAEIRNSTLITRLLNLADDDFDNFDFSTDDDDMFINASQKTEAR